MHAWSFVGLLAGILAAVLIAGDSIDLPFAFGAVIGWVVRDLAGKRGG